MNRFLSVLIVLSVLGGEAWAQAYPVKPVRLVVPFPAGASSDVVGRMLAQKLSEQLGQQVVTDNRAGAGGNLGLAVAAKSPPDGYTIVIATASIAVSPSLYLNPGYDALKDLAPLARLTNIPNVLIVHPSVPAKTVKEFVAFVKARPGQLRFASAGSGTSQHLSGELFMMLSGTKMIHVPYKGGGPATIALASGETQAMTATIGSLIPHIASKRVRPLGVTSAKRVQQYPDVPAISESVPGYEFVAWIGAFVAAGTPRPIVDRLNGEFRKALAQPDTARILSVQTLDPMPMSPEEFAKLLRVDFDKYEKVIKQSGAKID
jgi:tripartite-type tricarboxylate transporter receptor subunit TctC